VIEQEGAGGLADHAEALPPIVEPVNPPRPERSEPLSQNRDFLLLLGGQGISAFGDALSLTAVPLLVLALTGSGVAMGVVGVLNTIPDLVFGLLAGVIADRSDRRLMILGADLGRAALTALIPLAILFHGPTMLVILLIAAPMSMLRALFLAAYTAAMPSLVGRPLLGRATATLETVYSLSFVIGPSVAGVLAATVGFGPTIAVDALSFLGSAGAMALIRRPLQERQDHPPLNLRKEIREGIAYIAGHPSLRVAVSYWGAISVITAGLIPVLTYFVTRQLGLGAAAFGLLLTVNGVGYLLGAIAMNRVRLRPAGLIMLGGTVIQALALVVAVNGAPIVLYPAAFVVGISSAAVAITYITFRSAAAPDELLGRVGSTARTLSIGLQPIGMITAGILLDAIGGGATLLLMGGGLFLATCGFALSRTLRHAQIIGGHVPRERPAGA
jgi:MFS transporter, ENTS family, enterobactin (siderophore) exporter